jgi:hypothetical protein
MFGGFGEPYWFSPSVTVGGMPQLFAQQADVRGLHLETMCILGEWEWWVLDMKGRSEVGRGKSTSLGDAMLAAELSAGGDLRQLAWHNIGAEVTNERKRTPAAPKGS